MTVKNTKIINLWAAPSRGKSTTAAGIFYRMKVEGFSVELINEYAKDMTWENRDNILKDQLYILAKQNRKISRLIGKVDYVVTDSPLLMGLNYTPDTYYENFKPFVFDVWDGYENINFFLHNDGNLTYDPTGRNQSEEEADKIDKKIYNFLLQENVPFTPVKIIANNVNIKKNHINDIFKHLEGKETCQLKSNSNMLSKTFGVLKNMFYK